MAKKRGSSSDDNPEDAFLARLLALSTWARQNTQVVIVAGVLLVVGIAAGIYYYNYQVNLRNQAAQEFQSVQQTAAMEDPEAARTELQNFIDRYGSTPYGTEARLLLAEAHLQQDAPEQAVAVLEPEADRLSDPLSIQAAFLLATAYEQAEQPQEAEELYLRLADAAEMTFQVRDALAEAASIRAREENYAGAAELYRRILDTYEEDQASGADRTLYELRLAEMEAAARTSGRGADM